MTKADGSVECYKARLVTKGYSQKYGLDYEGTFAPVAKITTVRTLIAVDSVRKWKIFQMDVKNAYLYGDLHEEVYVTPPSQSSASTSNHDSALFVRSVSANRILLSLYFDDMIITDDDCDGIESLKHKLAHFFAMEDLGLLCYFSGIKVASSLKGYLLCQFKYIADFLDRACLMDNKTMETPLKMNARYSPFDGLPLAEFRAYSETDWAGNPEDRKSTTVQSAVTDKQNFASNILGSQQSDIRTDSTFSRTFTIMSSRSHLASSRSGKAQLKYSLNCNNSPILSCITNRSTPTKNISSYPASSNNTPIMSSRSHNTNTCHINEKRISKLYKDGYLDKFDFESYEECKSCLIGRMAKAPFTGQGERATE
ncbi:hypothetical protein AgCh_010273 [Apium graveolens]